MDITVQNEGTIFLFTPHTPEALVWIEENVGGLGSAGDAVTWWGRSLVVEHRFIEDIVQGAINDGLVVV